MKRDSRGSGDVDGDPFDVFVAARYQALLRSAFLITGNVHDARDLLHDALARVYPKRSTIRDPDAAEGYVRTAMVRTHVSRWRRTRREVLTSVLPETAQEPADAGDGRLAEALRALPKRQRAAVVLRYYVDLPVARVAEELGCGVPTVKTHLARAVRALRQELSTEKELAQNVR
ncbi:SigE family RNA polymerase sigma factor [Kitasatospora sp. SUK 42]|uniref:SigE family RNA polymerase sigma factor n=1 Tax=Kitasatospora sp. SUK 42 TaxID=1588882 RepID=UPI0018CA416E|nr:SigE family RNA polymerase sigma factor [Kitasatospora sp. SUK 42]MBV2152303.1 SigE family RNA polymerase sigma factor [Kitasatospora sp. SUK 42]